MQQCVSKAQLMNQFHVKKLLKSCFCLMQYDTQYSSLKSSGNVMGLRVKIQKDPKTICNIFYLLAGVTDTITFFHHDPKQNFHLSMTVC